MPALGGALLILLALPVFILFHLTLAGWGLAAVLWVAVHGIDVVLAQTRTRSGNLATSGVQAFGLFFKAIGLLVVLLVAAVANPRLAVAAALTYALAYTFELGLSIVTYLGATR